MCEDVLGRVLDTCKLPEQALSSSSDALYHLLCCPICTNIMLEPYMISCGHTFCGECLNTWTNQSTGLPTCPTCRKVFSSKPALSFALRETALIAVSSFKRQNPDSNLKFDETTTTRTFLHKKLPLPVYDIRYKTYRCVECNLGVTNDNICENCNEMFSVNNKPKQSKLPIDDPWKPVEENWECFDDVWNLFTLFLKQIRSQPTYRVSPVLPSVLQAPAEEFQYLNNISVPDSVVQRRIQQQYLRWERWLLGWNSMIDMASRFGMRWPDPFRGDKRNPRAIKGAFKRFLGINHGNEYRPLHLSRWTPNRLTQWLYLYKGACSPNE